MPDAAIDIPNLHFLYAEHLDAGRFQEVARMFDHGCVVVYGEEIRGAEAIEAMIGSFIRIYEDGTPKTRHLTSNIIIELAGDGLTASTRSLWTLFQATDTLPPQVIGGGRYHDRFAVIDGAWQFARASISGVMRAATCSARQRNGKVEDGYLR